MKLQIDQTEFEAAMAPLFALLEVRADNVLAVSWSPGMVQVVVPAGFAGADEGRIRSTPERNANGGVTCDALGPLEQVVRVHIEVVS